MLAGFAGLTARGVSFWAVVSRLTLTTLIEAPFEAALKLGVRVVVGDSWAQAARKAPATSAHSDVRRCMCKLRKVEAGIDRRVEKGASSLRVYLAPRRLLSIFPLRFRPGSSVGRAAD